MHVENRDKNEKNYNYLTFHLVNNNESNDKNVINTNKILLIKKDAFIKSAT